MDARLEKKKGMRMYAGVASTMRSVWLALSAQVQYCAAYNSAQAAAAAGDAAALTHATNANTFVPVVRFLRLIRPEGTLPYDTVKVDAVASVQLYQAVENGRSASFLRSWNDDSGEKAPVVAHVSIPGHTTTRQTQGTRRKKQFEKWRGRAGAN
eukprot:CAMPEP_0119419976 /NCGR_PEP_ID=MMETSP1335-20130426/22277_1 /TAXON_ID=259385 /ORGANISM="Chrysoculter rhomboideus, Strain RCC1486" /LENGTH=153 /DNA_ID=CAMNT_0007445309 /DNA_START=604 /DNA_END=1061 /DNA_ORIENTATION=+